MLGNSFNSAQFYIDIEGHPSNSSVKMALEELGFFSKEVRILGVYKGDSNREKNSFYSNQSFINLLAIEIFPGILKV